MELRQYLEKSPDAFTDYDEKDLQSLFEQGRVRHLDPGSYLIVEGTKDETAYLLLDGELEIVKEFKDKSRTISYINPGNWVGEMAFLRKIPRTASAIATKPSKALSLDKETFTSLDQELRLYLVKMFNELAADRVNVLMTIQEELIDQRARRIYSLRSSKRSSETPEEKNFVESVIENIPRLPMYAGNLISFIHNPEIPASQLADVIRQDPSLAAQVLKNVNSPYYGFQQKIVDLQHAITLLGVNQLYLLILFNAMRTTMPNIPPFINLQRHSVIMSFMALKVASMFDKKFEPLAASLGLLHDIGKSVILLMKFNHPSMSDLFNVLDHYILGNKLLMRWNLPEEICESIKYLGLSRVAPLDEIPQEYRTNVSLLSIAHPVSEVLQSKGPKKPVFWDSYIEHLNFGEKSMEDIAFDHVLPELRKEEKILPLIIRNLLQQSSTEHKKEEA